MSRKPVIGITAGPMSDVTDHGTFQRFRVSADYVNAVHAAGGLPIVLPPQEGNIANILETVDGLVFSGGADIDPREYGDQEVHPKTYDISPLRDKFELDLMRAAIAADVPSFCICRGVQVLNVACGGTLIQDVPDQYDPTLVHDQGNSGLHPGDPAHTLATTIDGRLREIYGSDHVQVNSFHHQAVKDVAPGLVVEGKAEDGLIEAVTMPDRTFVVGVQWHPEMMFARHQEHLRPFVALVQSARAKQLSEVR